MVTELGMVAIAHHRHGLAERRPNVVVVDAGGHHAHDHLERARLGHLDLLDPPASFGSPKRSSRITQAAIVLGSSPGSTRTSETCCRSIATVIWTSRVGIGIRR